MSAIYGETKGIINVMEQGSPYSKPQYKQIAWNADYDGDIANIDYATINNGKAEVLHQRLDNADIMRMLSVQPVEMSLDKRLIQDFGATDLMALEGIRSHKKPKHLSRKYKRRRHSHKKGYGKKSTMKRIR